ncbi:MAG: DUF6916 family protein [Pyrinomonadaceae bacterium]
MSITRRRFLHAGGIVMVAAGTPVSLNALAAERRAGDSGLPGQPSAVSALMNKAMFAAHLHTVFHVQSQAGQTVPLELVALHDRGPAQSSAVRAGQECFALAFRTRNRPALKQNTYQMEHRALGRFDLFITPVRSEKYGQVYEAIINHVRA